MEVKATFQGIQLLKVLELLKQYQGNCKIIAGGTDLIIQLRERKINPEILIDISSLQEIRGIKTLGDFLEIGAVTTFTDLLKSPLLQGNLQGMVTSAKAMGSPQIRNAATLGGNICNASPAADIIPSLLVLDSMVFLQGLDDQRSLLLEDFLIDKGKVDLKPHELLCTIRFKNIRENEGLGFAKLGFRKALAISKITVAVFIEVESNHFKSIKIATGSCGKLARRERNIETFMIGKPVEPDSIEMGAVLFKTELINRLAGRHGGEYKSQAVQGVFKEALHHALKNAGNPNKALIRGVIEI